MLDVGCGPGHHTAHLRALGVQASGLDLVPEFINHARATYPGVPFQLGSMRQLPVVDHSVAGILAWYSVIHTPPDEIGGVFAEFHRAMAPGGTLVVGFVDGDEVVAFEHRVATAYYWPADELMAQLQRAGSRRSNASCDRGWTNQASGHTQPSQRPPIQDDVFTGHVPSNARRTEHPTLL